MNVPALMATYQLRQREYLLRITRAMTSRLDLPSLLELILSSAAEMVAAPAGMIVLHEPAPAAVFDVDSDGVAVEAEPQARIRTTYGIPAQLLPAFAPLLRPSSPPLPPDSDGASSVQTPGEQYRRDLERRVQDVEENLGRKLGQVLGLPLFFEDELLGVIYLFRGGSAFTQLDWEFLEGFALQAAIAVRNARLYAQLSTERSRLAAIIEKSADGVLILRPDRRVEVINQTMETMLGRVAEDVVGQPCSQVLDLQNVTGDDLCGTTLVDVPHQGLRCEGELVRASGSNLAVSVTYTPLFDESERLVNIIANVSDITRFREEEEMKSTFVSIISHELKTPVALVRGYAQTLARPDATWDQETARQSLQIIEEEADRLEVLINNLLDVSRIQAGDLRLDISDVNMNRLLERIAQDYRTQTTQHQIEVDLPDDLPLVSGDEERLRQVFTNLLGNAIKYSPDGGLIRIGAWVDRKAGDGERKSRLVVYVADAGIGIPEDELPKIFDRFYRVDSTLRRKTAGVGLGLFLINAIVEAHKGEIWVRSEVNKGTTFSVALPIEDDKSRRV
ncbi:MAG: PAS domain-containing protein [Chloroflexi bacterium]|nr:MAG: PAS domain-containing protein [Chloroflexota bacterium]